jgi:hypothetical protein
MSAIAIQQMADRVADLIEQRLGIRGKDLATKARKARRALPRKVALAAGELAQLAEQAQNPKLLVQVDQGRVAELYDICVRHLSSLQARSRLLTRLINVAATLAFGLLLLGAGVIAILRMRGQI